MEELSECQLEEMYDRMLDELYDDVSICGLSYSPSVALFRVDETAYECGFNNYIDQMIKDEYIIEQNGLYYRE